MKLYTEDQLKQAVDKAMTMWLLSESSKEEILDSLTPIELPSDEEIEKAANTQSHYEGAMWLKYKILNQNK